MANNNNNNNHNLSKIAKRDRLASEDVGPRGRNVQQHRRQVICARIAVVVAMVTVTMLVSVVCVMAHQEQQRLLEKERTSIATATDDLAIVNLRKFVDQAKYLFGERIQAEHSEQQGEHGKNGGEMSPPHSKSHKGCTIILSRKLRGHCATLPEGQHVCISGRHMVDQHEQCGPI